jgi:hypothetical protein
MKIFRNCIAGFYLGTPPKRTLDLFAWDTLHGSATAFSVAVRIF